MNDRGLIPPHEAAPGFVDGLALHGIRDQLDSVVLQSELTIRTSTTSAGTSCSVKTIWLAFQMAFIQMLAAIG
jgi:hypothetical protein